MANIHLAMSSSVKIGQDIFFSDTNFNGLFKFNCITKKTELIHRFEELDDNIWLHSDLLYYNGTIILSPFNCDKIMLYDIKENQTECLYSFGFPVEGVSFIKDDQLFLFSSKFDYYAMIFDLKAGKIVKENSVFQEMCHNLSNNEKINVIYKEDFLIVSLLGTNTFLVLDYSKNEWRKVTLEEIKEGIHFVDYYNDRFWIVLESDFDIYSYNEKEDKLERIIACEEQKWSESAYNVFPYIKIANVNGQLFLINYNSQYLLKVMGHQLIRAFEYPTGYGAAASITTTARWGKNSGVIVEGNDMWVMPQCANMILHYNILENTLEGCEVVFNESEVPMPDVVRNYSRKSLLKECGEVLTLENFIKSISEI